MEKFRVTAQDAVDAMRLAKNMFWTKNGEFYSPESEAYFERMAEYTAYCKENMRLQWNYEVRKLICKASELAEKNRAIVRSLHNYEDAGEIMALMHRQSLQGINWEEVADRVQSCRHNKSTMSFIVLTHSPYGLEYIENAVSKTTLIDSLPLMEEYQRQKENSQSRPSVTDERRRI